MRRDSDTHSRREAARLARAARNEAALQTEDLLDTLGARAARGGFTAISNQVYRVLLQLAAGAILGRLLKPEDFGLIALSMTITGFVSMFTDLGLHSATVQRPRLDQQTASGMFFINTAAGIIIMIVCFALAPVASSLFKDERVAWVIVASAATFPISALSSQHGALLWRRMRFRTVQTISTFSQTVSTLLSVFLAWKTDAGYWALVASTWANAIIHFILLWYYSGWRPSWVSDWSGALESFSFGAYLTGFSLADFFHRQFDNILIGWKFGAAELGFYTRAYALFYLPVTALIFPVFEISKSVLSRATDDGERYRRLFHMMLFPLNVAAGAMSGVMYITSPVAVTLLYGEQWEPSVRLFQILSVCMSVQAVTVSLMWIFVSTGRTKSMFISQVLSSTVFSGAFLIAVSWNVVAVATAYTIVSLALTLPMIWIAVRGTPFTFSGYVTVQLPIPIAALAALGLVLQIGPGSRLHHLNGAIVESAAFLGLYVSFLAFLMLPFPSMRVVAAAVARKTLCGIHGPRSMFRKQPL